MKKEYESPKFESVEVMQSYCDTELNVSSTKLGGSEGMGNEDLLQ